ncbi:MAG TPA: hypothetical protein VEC15_04670 [Actinomycetota bacterium]|nr:hypothetical protein [Actinomycetota bacterium]
MAAAQDVDAPERRRSAMFGLKTAVARSPSLAPRVARARHHGVVLGPGTEVVIEGHPRSANSFSVVAFEVAQGRRTAIAHHTHAPGHVLAAVRSGVPAIVLIRDPADAVLEFLLIRPRLDPEQAVRAWTSFYTTVRPALGRAVLAPFPVVTTDFGRVIRVVNERNGTTFVPFEHTPENQQRCFEAMDAYWTSRAGEGREKELKVGRPSEERERLAAELRPILARGAAGRALADASALYERLAGEAPV